MALTTLFRGRRRKVQKAYVTAIAKEADVILLTNIKPDFKIFFLAGERTALSSPFFSGYFGDGSLTNYICQGWP
jgi:hypothetical protein